MHVDGLTGRVDGQVGVPRSRGHELRLSQFGHEVNALDSTASELFRIDPIREKILASQEIQRGSSVISDGRNGYLINQLSRSLQPLTGPTRVMEGAPRAGIGDDAGGLWVTIPAKGRAVAYREGRQIKSIAVAAPGDLLVLRRIAGRPAVINTTRSTVTIISSSGLTRELPLHPTISGVLLATAKSPEAVEGSVLPLLASDKTIVLFDLRTGVPGSLQLSLPRHTFAAPQVVGQRLYLPDESAGSLVVFNMSAHRMEPPVPISGRPSRIEAFVKDGFLWASDPDGPAAVVVEKDGRLHHIVKYRERKARTTPSPSAVPSSSAAASPTLSPAARQGGEGPPGPGQGSSTPGPRPSGTAPSPSPSRAPSPSPGGENTLAPENVQGTPGDGYVDITFSPPKGGRPLAYEVTTLEERPARMPYPYMEPERLPADAQELRIRAQLGICHGGTHSPVYHYRAVAIYKQKKVASAPTPLVRSCLPPGAPERLTATSLGTGTVRLDWYEQANARYVSYDLDYEGRDGSYDNEDWGEVEESGPDHVVIRNLTPGRQYTFTLIARTRGGDSPPASITWRAP
ncbi:fibronectin type III domain-containing protein [Actinomadura macrotermitis]|uniref:fibronectin type III domain-containing protein n=1 Tax=Actinomadura macrotermitis TaxID=2585200 RepID=UPI00188660BF|nr:fibronectin type III domain-containing protein [Actinomadura macrotermitis]